MKKKHIGKAAMIFFGIMLALTFCSRTVYRALMPQAQTVRVNGGILTYTQQSDSYQLDASELQYTYIDEQLPQAVRIERVLVKQNQRVEEGTPLVQLYAPEAEQALQVAREEFARAEITWKRWDTEQTAALLDLKSQIEQAESPEKKRQLQQELSLVQQGIIGNDSQQLCYEQYVHAEAILDVLEKLQADDWMIIASQSGWIGEIYLKAGDGYQGLAPLVSIVSGEVMVGIEWDHQIDLDRDAARIIAQIEAGEQKLDCQYMRSADGVAWLACTEEIAYEQIRSISLTAETGFIETLVRNEALMGDNVYLLSSRAGSWGEEEYCAKRAQLKLGRTNGTMTEVLGGLIGGEEVIITSTKELSDGATVLLKGVYK